MNKSESIKNLALAMVKFNCEVGKVAKDANNPFFKNKYATLDTIIDEVRPLLAKNGLTLMQIPGGDGDNVMLKTFLMHESGEWMESDRLIMKPVKNDPQAIGSCITYARRYSLNSFLSLNTGEDDDANKATGLNEKTRSNQARPQSLASDAQIKKLFAMVKVNKIPDTDIKAKLSSLGKTSSKELSVSEIQEIYKWIEQQSAGA